MNLSPQQAEALEVATTWYETKSAPVLRVFGFAGTGKTTIAKQFGEMVDGVVLFCAYTGKAAHVLREKGCKNAATLHSLIYIPKSKSRQRLRDLQADFIRKQKEGASLITVKKLIEKEKENVKGPSFSINPDSALNSSKLLIVDEVSMVNKQMGEDILSFGTPVLVLGDPAQLPPVKGGGYFTNVKPDVMLTEVHRQAAGSEILKAATRVREGHGLGDCPLVVPKGQLGIGDLAEFDQILVGTHKSRHAINAQMREYLGRTGPLPEEGDRLICTRNDSETGLLNGSQWLVEWAGWDGDTGKLDLSLKSVDGEERVTVPVHPEPFQGEEIPYWGIRDAQCFEYGYSITVHKAQGSGFGSVCLIDESYKFPAHQRRAHLYTGITRASHELTIIK